MEPGSSQLGWRNHQRWSHQREAMGILLWPAKIELGKLFGMDLTWITMETTFEYNIYIYILNYRMVSNEFEQSPNNAKCIEDPNQMVNTTYTKLLRIQVSVFMFVDPHPNQVQTCWTNMNKHYSLEIQNDVSTIQGMLQTRAILYLSSSSTLRFCSKSFHRLFQIFTIVPTSHISYIPSSKLT